MKRPSPGRFLVSVGIVAAALAIAWVWLGRIDPVPDPGASHPAASYAEAIARIDSIRAHEGDGVNPVCHTRVLTSGAKVANVIVLLHGFTNCPKQFDSLAAGFARRGYNVYQPLLPRHGAPDRMSQELARLTADELTHAGRDAVDIARGLGDHVTVMGLSSSAIVTAWLAQHRPDVDRAVLIAPSFAPRKMRAPVVRRMANVLLRAPNFFVWWDGTAKADVAGPRQCYPRFASRALAEVYRLGFTVLDDAARSRPAAGKIVILTTALDEGVNNDPAKDLARRWRARGAEVRTYEFPESLGVRHDMIDPEQPYQRVSVSYPVLERMAIGADDPR